MYFGDREKSSLDFVKNQEVTEKFVASFEKHGTANKMPILNIGCSKQKVNTQFPFLQLQYVYGCTGGPL